MNKLTIKSNLNFIYKLFINKPSLFFILFLLILLNVFIFLIKKEILKKIIYLLILIIISIFLFKCMDIIKLFIKYIIYPKPFILVITSLILIFFNLQAKYKIQKFLLIFTNSIYMFCIILFVANYIKLKDTIKYNYMFYKNSYMLNILTFSNICIIFSILVNLFILIYYKMLFGKNYIYDNNEFIEKL